MEIIPPSTDGLSDVNIKEYRTIPTAEEIRTQMPLEDGEHTVRKTRQEIRNILDGRDNRKIIIAGPCSVHDIDEATEFTSELKQLADQVSDVALVVARLCYEKPRTGPAWQGYLWEPQIDGKGGLEEGIRGTRSLLIYAALIGMGVGAEHVETSDMPHYLGDTLSYGWIGARTSGSQEHHKWAARSSLPVGMKNSLDGKIEPLIEAMRKAHQEGTSAGRTRDGRLAEVVAKGNKYTHVILRGTDRGPNYNADDVCNTQNALSRAGLSRSIIIDCSHGNSGKDHKKQPGVLYDVVSQMKDNHHIRGVMIEAYFEEGNQPIPEDRTGFDRTKLKPRTSGTDKCVSLSTLKEMVGYTAQELRRYT